MRIQITSHLCKRHYQEFKSLATVEHGASLCGEHDFAWCDVHRCKHVASWIVWFSIDFPGVLSEKVEAGK
jgi:hypothetical protein